MPVIEQWEGIVTAVRSDDFIATIVSLVTDRGEELEATIPKREVAVFYWTIESDVANGQRRSASTIRFRRLSWTSLEIQQLRAEADELAVTLGVTAKQEK